jgi:hypothetical protein
MLHSFLLVGITFQIQVPTFIHKHRCSPSHELIQDLTHWLPGLIAYIFNVLSSQLNNDSGGYLSTVLPEGLKDQVNPTFMVVGPPSTTSCPRCSQCIFHHFDPSEDGGMRHELPIPLHDTEAQLLGTSNFCYGTLASPKLASSWHHRTVAFAQEPISRKA